MAQGQIQTGHIEEALFLLTEFKEGWSDLGIEELLNWGESAVDLLAASLSHHGRPINSQVITNSKLKDYWKPRPQDGYDPRETLRELGTVMRDKFPAAFTIGGTPLPTKPAFQHGFAGIMQLADWLGSHTTFFPINREGIQVDPAKVIFSVGLDTSASQAFLVKHHAGFSQVFGFDSNPMQAATSSPNLGTLTILEAETGSGKTEAALWRFKTLFEMGEIDSLYFALPTRVAAKQIHQRISKAAQQLFPEEHRPEVVLAVPGYLKVADSEGKRLPHFEVLWSDNPNESQALRRWPAENAKRFLAAAIAVGTIDQALLAALQVKHAHLRAFTLARSLLVVDEVHASDTYMSEILARLIKNHRLAGGHVLLMSATLGASARQLYLSNSRTPSPLSETINYPYPCLSCTKEAPQTISSTGRKKTYRLNFPLSSTIRV